MRATTPSSPSGPGEAGPGERPEPHPRAETAGEAGAAASAAASTTCPPSAPPPDTRLARAAQQALSAATVELVGIANSIILPPFWQRGVEAAWPPGPPGRLELPGPAAQAETGAPAERGPLARALPVAAEVDAVEQ